ncbi:DUF1804 family protein [Pandoraea apista]|uniref:DUF1804 family protein n=1 Tax=Pandoraea apista TaxID=93218 RepID=UPI000F6715E6|nr:DUF1804 family protein [Pandoraea apista]RRW90606.1 DUF1804 family protein [Pandoraea apista]RRX00398.1 DUF1804 family protein [Pandoraea apista]
MAHPKNVREILRAAYVDERLTLDASAEKAGISIATARRWKTEEAQGGDDWDKALAVDLMVDGGFEGIARQLLSGLIRQYQVTMAALEEDGEIVAAEKVKLLASLADAFHKTIAASKRILPETNELAVALGVVQRLATFMKERYPQHVDVFAEMLDAFGDELSTAYGV